MELKISVVNEMSFEIAAGTESNAKIQLSRYPHYEVRLSTGESFPPIFSLTPYLHACDGFPAVKRFHHPLPSHLHKLPIVSTEYDDPQRKMYV